MADNPYGIQKPKTPEMPGMVNKMAQGQADNDFAFKGEKDIWRMSDKDRTSYWTGLDKFRNQVGDEDSRFKDYRNALSGTLRSDYDSTHLNLTGAPSSTPGFGYYIPPEERAKHMQQEQATEFRSALPNTQREMAERFTSEANRGLSAANKNTQQQMASRGLLYSGINQGAQAANRARTQAGIAQGISDMNTGLQDSADSMDMEAIQTGMGIQQAQQQIQNQIYSQAMARMAAHNQMVGAGIGLISSAGMMYAGSRGK